VTHIVIFDREPGTPVYHHAETLGAAVAEVERLRNSEGITNSRIFELQPVAFEFQPYFRVSLDSAEAEYAEYADYGEYDDVDEGHAESSPTFSSIDLRAEDMSGFTTYPIGRRLFSR
jgi:hypothetical protein